MQGFMALNWLRGHNQKDNAGNRFRSNTLSLNDIAP